VDLVVVDHEVLPQDGQTAGCARLHEIVVGAAEIRLVGQDRERGRAILQVDARDLGGRGARSQFAARGRPALELGDHRHSWLT
jgi:hypothetical protein